MIDVGVIEAPKIFKGTTENLCCAPIVSPLSEIFGARGLASLTAPALLVLWAISRLWVGIFAFKFGRD